MQQEEFESPTSRFVAECSIQLSYCCIYRKYYKIHLQHFHLKYIFKGNFRGKLTRKSLKPFNTNNFEIECVRFVAERSIQLSYKCICLFIILVFCFFFNSFISFLRNLFIFYKNILQIAHICAIFNKYLLQIIIEV